MEKLVWLGEFMKSINGQDKVARLVQYHLRVLRHAQLQLGFEERRERSLKEEKIDVVRRRLRRDGCLTQSMKHGASCRHS